MMRKALRTKCHGLQLLSGDFRGALLTRLPSLFELAAHDFLEPTELAPDVGNEVFGCLVLEQTLTVGHVAQLRVDRSRKVHLPPEGHGLDERMALALCF